MIELQTRPKQADFASVIGVSQQNVSALMAEGKLPTGGTWAELLIAYCHRLREVAAGRMSGELGGLDLVQERAGLAKAQREAQELKNAVARGEYAPIGILADVLGLASSAIVDRMDQFEGQVRKACHKRSSRSVRNIAVAGAAKPDCLSRLSGLSHSDCSPLSTALAASVSCKAWL